MKLEYIYPIITVIFLSCGNRKESSNNVEEYNGPDTTIIIPEDSIVSDTVATRPAEPKPAEIISSKIVRERDDLFGNVVITFKNISGKTIEAIEFSWEEVDSFGVPVGETHYNEFSRKSFIANYYKETATIVIQANKVGRTSFQILRDKPKKLTNVEIRRVAFSDGSLWRP